MKELPSDEYGDIYNYLILNRASDGEQMIHYKSLDSFNYFKSGCVGRVLHYNFKHVNTHENFVLLKTEVRPSQRTNADFHKPWVLCSAVGTMYKADCSCMAEKCMYCSHVGALLWKIEHAVRRGLADKSCTNEQVKWNKGASRNLEPGVIKQVNFKKLKITCETEDIFDDENNNIQNSKSSFTLFTKQKDLLSFVEKSALKPLFHLKNSIRSVHANIKREMPTSFLNHSEHTGGNHAKSVLSFMKSHK